MARLSTELQRYFFEEDRQPQVKLIDILSLAGERIFGFLFLIIALPSALPVPAPGYSLPFGFVLLLLAIQLIGGAQRPWLPQKMMNHAIKLETVQGFVKAGIPWLKRLEAIARPRFTYICTSLPGRVVIGVAISLMSISMMIILPLTNTLPAIGIFITSFGLIEDDGAISLAGLFVCLMGALLTTSILIFGVTAVYQVINLIKSGLGL
ncbi:MAG: exopolysaccharide biosynthesis protein [Symploca sp. SIO1C2]|nr:exopolysaccharide biosynthesis protein [Symploca sp. SIO1C2]